MITNQRRTSRMSLQRKTTLWTVAITIVLQGLANFLVLSQHAAQIDSFFDARMQMRLRLVVESIAPNAGAYDDRALADLIDWFAKTGLEEHLVLALYAEDGSVLASSIRPAPDASAFPIREAFSSGQAAAHLTPLPPQISQEHGAVGRAAVRRIQTASGAPAALAVIGDDRYGRDLVTPTRWLFVTLLLIGACTTGLSAWIIAGLVTRPLRDLRTFTQSMEPEHLLQPVVPAPYAAEIAEVREQMAQTREKLQAAFRAQERFMLNASHELKTPIAVVLTEADTLSPDLPRPEVHKFVSSMREEMKRLGSLIDSFLTLALVQSGKPVARPRTYLVNEFVMDAVHACQREADLAKVILDPTLTLEHRVMVYGDPQLLRAMIENLIRNAVRFSPQGQPVQITVGVQGSQSHIAVRDFGPGVPPEVMARIFDRFAQAPAEVGRGRGHGLGLSIAKGIAELHHGRITVENMKDAGCTFTVHLPLAPSQDPPPIPPAGPSGG